MKTRHTLFASLSAVLGLGFYLLMRGQGFSDLTSYIYLVPLVSAYFLFIDRKAIFADVRYVAAVPAALFASAAVIFGSGAALSGDARLFIWALAVVTLWWGVFVLFFGIRSASAALFPLGFLVLCAPLPEAVVIPAEEVLKFCSACSAWALFEVARVPFVRDGTTFHLSNLSVEVAPQCSGINSALSLVITAVVAGRMFLKTNSRRVALAILAAPIACFKNGCRIFTLSVIGNYATIGILSGPLHKQGGKPFFVLALAFLGIALWALRRTERRSP